MSEILSYEPLLFPLIERSFPHPSFLNTLSFSPPSFLNVPIDYRGETDPGNKGATPPYNPQETKSKKKRSKTTRRKRPPCPSFLSVSIRNPNKGRENPLHILSLSLDSFSFLSSRAWRILPCVAISLLDSSRE